MRLSYLSIPVLLFLSLSAFSNAEKEVLVGTGQYTSIKNLSDPHVVEIAQYAVTEHNNQSGQHLKLEKILKGEYQVVAGINYRLVLNCKEPQHYSGNYLAIVYERPWESFKNLTYFRQLLTR